MTAQPIKFIGFREQEIYRSRQHGQTFAEIAERWGITRARTHQIYHWMAFLEDARIRLQRKRESRPSETFCYGYPE